MKMPGHQWKFGSLISVSPTALPFTGVVANIQIITQ